MRNVTMSDHDVTMHEGPAAGAPRRRRRLVVAAIAGVAAVAALVSFAPGPRLPGDLPMLTGGLAAAAASLEGGSAAESGSPLYDRMVDAVVAYHADRAVRRLAVEIDASQQQQDKLRAIVDGAVKDLLPVRQKLMTARASARDLLTRDTVDRAAIEQFRVDMVAVHDAASRRLAQAVADAAEVLTPEQRRKIADLADHHGRWGHGPFGHWGHWDGWRN